MNNLDLKINSIINKIELVIQKSLQNYASISLKDIIFNVSEDEEIELENRIYHSNFSIYIRINGILFKIDNQLTATVLETTQKEADK